MPTIASSTTASGPHIQKRGEQLEELKRSDSMQEKEVEGEEEEDDERDVRRKQTFQGRYLFWLAYQSIGVIYDDIGTSPSTLRPSAPSLATMTSSAPSP